MGDVGRINHIIAKESDGVQVLAQLERGFLYLRHFIGDGDVLKVLAIIERVLSDGFDTRGQQRKIIVGLARREHFQRFLILGEQYAVHTRIHRIGVVHID